MNNSICRSLNKKKSEIDSDIQFYDIATKNDQWVIKEIFPNKRKGFFIECGAHKGKNASSCYSLEKYFDWKGVCIEAAPIHLNDLKRNRSNLVLNVLLSDKKQSDHLFAYFKNIEWRSMAVRDKVEFDTMIKGFDAEYHNDATSPERKKILEKLLSHSELLKVKSFTLQEILEKHNSPKIIDYLSMDIEGFEYNVLKNFPFEKYTILAISIEGNRCTELLKSKGYSLVKNSYNVDNDYEKYYLHEKYYL